MFSVGDLVVHPMHGAGIIDAIVQEKIDGSILDYYVFKMPMGGLILKIPIANSEAIGLRAVVDRNQADDVLRAIPTMTVEGNSNWNKRYRENLLRLKSGDLYQVAMVIKSLMYRDQQRGLSTGERKMLHSAKQILLSEMVLVQNCPYDEAEARVNLAMVQRPNAG